MLEFAALSDVGSVRRNNEDYCTVVPELGLFVLADGMGGAKGGEYASRLAVETVVSVIQGAGARDPSILLKAVEDANAQVCREASRNPSLEGMGTTLVTALEVPKMQDSSAAPGVQMAIASVGDSRAYICDESGLRPITEDQTWVEEVGKPLGLDENSLKRHPMRHVLTMAIGVSAPLSIRYYSIRLNRGAFLMLCSDGLHGVVDPVAIEQVLKSEKLTLREKCQELIDCANEAGGPDNITIVLIQDSSDGSNQA